MHRSFVLLICVFVVCSLTASYLFPTHPHRYHEGRSRRTWRALSDNKLVHSLFQSTTIRLNAHAFDEVSPLQTSAVRIYPAKKPLSSLLDSTDNNQDQFSILSWNILLPNSEDNWWCHKMYASWVPMEAREWAHRQTLIRERLLLADADIVCLQEADGNTFEQDFAFMMDAGYQYCLHKKFRFRCVTFFKGDTFVLEDEAHKDRTLLTSLRCVNETSSSINRVLNVVNCHLSGGAAPERRLHQVHEALEQIRKWKAKVARSLKKQRKANRPSPKQILKLEEILQRHDDAGTIVCGDFNSDGNTGVRQFLVEGTIDPEWREPQYPNVSLTSKVREHSFGRSFVDAAEIAYQSNVCDGDYGEEPQFGFRPATYVVPNLASLLLLPITGERIPRTEFGMQVARGLADTLGLKAFCENEMRQAFESIDLDGNNVVDEDEMQQLLESAYALTYGRQIDEERRKFFEGFQSSKDPAGLSRKQLSEKLMFLQQDLEKQTDEGEFGQKIARGIANALGLRAFNETELELAFECIDLDGNDLIDESEVAVLLESVYKEIFRPQIEEERKQFFKGFTSSPTGRNVLSRKQLTERLVALQQELEGGHEGSELVEVRTEADAQRMIDRFSPLLKRSLDHVFDHYSGDDGKTLTKDEVDEFLIKANGQVGRGGTSRHATALFEKKAQEPKQARLTRRDWYAMFARELGEGKWWQVVYDLEMCGASIRSQRTLPSGGQHYQGWLDYIYFDSGKLACLGVQEALTDAEFCRIYTDGDAFPNKWHPSDHLPVAALFSWN